MRYIKSCLVWSKCFCSIFTASPGLISDVVIVYNVCITFTYQKTNTRTSASREASGSEDEDGIMKIQEQEFNMTKDPALGIVPKYRLYNTIADAYRQFQLTGGSTSRVEALSWIERGSYS